MGFHSATHGTVKFCSPVPHTLKKKTTTTPHQTKKGCKIKILHPFRSEVMTMRKKRSFTKKIMINILRESMSQSEESQKLVITDTEVQL